jgi:hypothetical protein
MSVFERRHKYSDFAPLVCEVCLATKRKHEITMRDDRREPCTSRSLSNALWPTPPCVDRVDTADYDSCKVPVDHYRFGFMPRPNEPSSLDPDVLRDIVRKHLPAWFRACAASAEIIVMHEEAFGTSAGEILLLGCALKYAGISGKTVHMTSGNKSGASRSKAKPIAIETIYREDRSPSPTRDTRKFASGRRRRSA